MTSRSICELLEITFRKEGHRVEVANTMDAANANWLTNFDIVISISASRVANGLDLLKFVKEVSPQCFFLPSPVYRPLKTAIGAI